MIGRQSAALLTGNGIALADSSIYGLVKKTYDLRMNAWIQQRAILLGGQITCPDGEADMLLPAPVPNGSGGAGAARFWEYWKRMVPIDF